MRRTIATFGLITALLLPNFGTASYAQQPNTGAPGQAAAAEEDSQAGYHGERRLNFNEDWRFQRETGGSMAGVQLPDYNDSSWRQLDLPHDWSIELDFNSASPATHEGGFLDGGTGWYRKKFTLPSSMEGKRITLDFDGVYMNSTVYLNGQELGTYPYGYNAFSYEITGNAYTDGRENVVAVKVNNTQPSSRWYSGSGIYRNVYLSVTNPIHVARYGTFITTPDLENDYKDGRANVMIETKVRNDSAATADVKVKSTVYDAAGNLVATVESEPEMSAAHAESRFEDQVTIQNPRLWSVDDPYRYKLVTEVIAGGQTVDTYETPFGIRYFKFDANEGFMLNGQYMKLHGVSMHHDAGALGAVANYRAVERQMQIMKDMGVNAIRVTHNPASPELLEACNQLGLLVIEEAFDTWNQSKKTYDYGRFFSAWAEHDIKEMVNRGKNEPAIIAWSIGNEIYDTTNANGVTIARNLIQWVKEVDTTRPTTIGEDKTRGNKVSVTTINPYIKQIFDMVDVVGLNYSENNYVGYHQQNPNWKLYGSETSSATRSRGIYTHPYQNNQSTRYADLQQSSYDNDYVSWGRTAEEAWKYDRDLKHIAGQFIWTGFDYIGEPTPYYNNYPSKSSYFGAVDTAGFPKDAFYYYQSQWSKKPMVHLLPHWNWESGETVRVLAYTNAHKVELWLNGQSLGEKSYENKTTSWGASYKETADGKTYLEWAVPFEPGTLEAVAKNEDGEIIANDRVTTSGAPAAVRLTADRRVFQADGSDLSFITADIIDSAGNIVPMADHLIQFNVSGHGQLVGVDNGNAASVERYKDNKRKAFSGKALAIVQSNKNTGSITLSAAVSGLAGDSINLFTVKSASGDPPIVAGIDEVNVVTKVNEAPVLPTAVNVYYSDSSFAAREVTWGAIDPTLYAKIGKFDVEGSMNGTQTKVKASIIVKDIVGIQPSSAATKVSIAPVLPSKVNLLYSDDTQQAADVRWDEIPQGVLDEPGNFILEGTLAETELKANAYIRVTNEVQTVNIMLRQPGSAYPVLEATFTNPGDNLNHINDGIMRYDNTGEPNRWTNWTRTPRESGDAITVDFGEMYTIDNLDLFVFTDSGTVVPESVTVQYWDGAAWINVSNQHNPSPYVTQKNTITFDAVETDKLKFHMTPSASDKFLALTEVAVHADQIATGMTAKLNGITVNGEQLTEFSPDKQEYTITLPYGSQLPEIIGTASDYATIAVLPALSFPGLAKLYVTSENGMVSSEYVVHVQSEAPKLVSAKLSADRTEIVEDDILALKVSGLLQSGEEVDLTGETPEFGFDNPIIKIENGKLFALGEGQVKITAKVTFKGVTVTAPEFIVQIKKNTEEKEIVSLDPVTVIVSPGEVPVLPATITAHYNQGLPRDIHVAWETIDSTLYSKPGEITVQGSAEGTTIKAIAQIVVKGAVAVQHIAMAVLQHQAPNLPEQLTVYYSNGTEEQKTVVWAPISEVLLGEIGMLKLEGDVEGIDLKAEARIRVTDEIGDRQNIARAKNGYDYPKAEASFTNRGPGSNDRIEVVNDDVVSYEADPHNRWTNWQTVKRPEDWVSITFGDFGPVEYDIDNMEIHWFEDNGTSYPAAYKIQYKSGADWFDVSNLQHDQVALKQANVHTFDMVRTSALRVLMTAQPDKGLAITEIKIFTKWPAVYSEPKVTDIQLNGNSIISEFTEVGNGQYDYTVELAGIDEMPQITAASADNTSITVVPAVMAPSTAKVIAKSEDGKKIVVYNIKYTLAPKLRYTISAAAGKGGMISPSGDVRVKAGESQSFIIMPDDGYEIDSIVVDGVPVNVDDNRYTFEQVAENHTISAVFKLKPPVYFPIVPPLTPSAPPPEVPPAKPPVTAPTTVVKLTDIDEHWAEASITKAVELGIVNGYNDGTFRPKDEVTRAQFAVMLGRALNLQGDDSSLMFADQDKIPEWARPFVAKAVSAGIIKGYDNNTFRSEYQLTRTEIVVMIVRALDIEIDPVAKPAFADADEIPAWARPYVAAAQSSGLIQGRGDGKFAASEKATRAEAVVLLLAMQGSKERSASHQ